MSDEADGKFITFRCECGQTIKAPLERAGAKGRCKACGRPLVVPMPAVSHAAPREDLHSKPQRRVPPVYRKDEYSEEDLITHSNEQPIRKEAPAPAPAQTERKGLFGVLGEILRYPFADKLATQIFLSGAVIFSPLVWLPAKPFLRVPCIGVIFFLIVLIAVISVRLMYFSYMLLIIEQSAAGSRTIPELPVFQSWDQHVADLIKVLGASAVAFSPYLAYAASVNIEVFGRMLEAYSKGAVPGEEVMGDVSSNLVVLVLLYIPAAFYMPMVLMALVMTRRFTKAVNPVFIFRSIAKIWREYLAAMFIVFLFLRGSLTMFTILKDVLASDWFAKVIGYVAEPMLKFYVFVVTMHLIGLLYYRNRKGLEW
ncbi:MAG: DUF4013 domain-containing protein [Candidatus Lindowbacteria bacterium]|nr:DUF4013 domain-containing protein [Candidatus Lindowbacteria bacterium]